MEDPLGLAGKVRVIERLPPVEVAGSAVSEAERKTVVKEILAAARWERKRKAWDFVE